MSISVSFATFLAEPFAFEQDLGFDFFAVFLGEDVFLVEGFQDIPVDLTERYIILLVKVLLYELWGSDSEVDLRIESVQFRRGGQHFHRG